jgi:membrane protease YdiL (CAAX protease family)
MRNSRSVLVLWLIAIVVLQAAALQAGTPVGEVLIATMVFGLLMLLYLLFSERTLRESLPKITGNGGEFGLPGLLWFIFLVLTLLAAPPNGVMGLVLAGAILWVPTGLIVRQEAALTPLQAVAGLTVLLIPLFGGVLAGASLTPTDVALRLGAFALPALLVALTTRAQKSRLEFYFISAMLFIWYTVEFDAAPGLRLPFTNGLISYMQLALIVLFLYLVTLAGRLPDVGYTFELNRRDWREVLINFALLAVITLPVGLLTGFIRPSAALPSVAEIAGRGVLIFFFVALPEEILFRGVIHRYLERVLRWAPLATLLLSSLIFGAAHLDNPPNVGYYFILASIAGWFYGRTYLRTGKVVPAALVHLLIDWVWAVFFAG